MLYLRFRVSGIDDKLISNTNLINITSYGFCTLARRRDVTRGVRLYSKRENLSRIEPKEMHFEIILMRAEIFHSSAFRTPTTLDVTQLHSSWIIVLDYAM